MKPRGDEVGDDDGYQHDLEAEIARLRAEVERLNERLQHLNDVADDRKQWWLEAQRERDEALAQVAALIEAIENSPLDSSDLTRMVAIGALSRAVDKARALLNRLELAERKLEDGQFCKEGLWYCRDAEEMAMRLQRAEAVIQAYGAFEDHLIFHKCDDDLCDVALDLGNARDKALAAWEEGKERT